IYKTEPQSKIGRRKKNLPHIKVSEQKEYEKEQNQINNDDTEQINDDLPAVIEETISAASNERVQEVRSPLPKSQKYTEEEQIILRELLNYTDLPKEVCMRINEELVKVNGSWTNKRVRDYCSPHRALDF
ncbi:24694_t:CDS:2, partial [Entrophospora sp. SA101]